MELKVNLNFPLYQYISIKFWILSISIDISRTSVKSPSVSIWRIKQYFPVFTYWSLTLTEVLFTDTYFHEFTSSLKNFELKRSFGFLWHTVSAKAQDTLLLILKNSTAFCISDKIPTGKVKPNPKINKIIRCHFCHFHRIQCSKSWQRSRRQWNSSRIPVREFRSPKQLASSSKFKKRGT